MRRCRLVEQPAAAHRGPGTSPRRRRRAEVLAMPGPAPGYGTHQAVRRFDFVPLWHIPVVFHLRHAPFVSCPRCGVRVEALPWATGKHRLTDAYAWFTQPWWAKRLSWQEVARTAFPTSCGHRPSGRAHGRRLGPRAPRPAPTSRPSASTSSRSRRGQRYLTLVYQIDGHCKRLLWVGRERKAATLERLLRTGSAAARSAALYFVSLATCGSPT